MWTINLTILPRLLKLALAMISVMLTTYKTTYSLPTFVTFGHVHGLNLHILIVITCATSMRTKKVSSVVSILKSFQPLEKVRLISNTSFLNKGSMELLLLLLQESKKQREELKSQTWDPESLSDHLQHPCGMPPFWREIDRWPSKIQLNIQNYTSSKEMMKKVTVEEHCTLAETSSTTSFSSTNTTPTPQRWVCGIQPHH